MKDTPSAGGLMKKATGGTLGRDHIAAAPFTVVPGTVVPVLFRFFLTPFFGGELRNVTFSRHPFSEIGEFPL